MWIERSQSDQGGLLVDLNDINSDRQTVRVCVTTITRSDVFLSFSVRYSTRFTSSALHLSHNPQTNRTKDVKEHSQITRERKKRETKTPSTADTRYLPRQPSSTITSLN
jgi:hypothetical protein